MLFSSFFFESNYYNEQYFDYFFYILIIILICSVMMIACYLISTSNLYYEKLTGYECGFDPFSEARDPFEIKFYLISILFILFDLELLYFFPWCFCFEYVSTIGFFWLVFFYESFLLVFFFEWKKKTLFFD